MPVNQLTKRAPDPRPERTRRAIFTAVDQLVSENPEKAPSVQEISGCAGVSRSSFYTYFPDLTTLASELLLDTFAFLGAEDLRRRQSLGTSPETSAREAVVGFVQYLRNHRVFYRASLDWQVTSHVHESLVEKYAQTIRSSAQTIENAPGGEELDDVAIFVAGGVIGRVTAWLRDDDPALQTAPVEETTQRLLALMPEWLTSRQQRG